MFYRHGLRRLRRLRLETPVNWPIIQQPRIVRIPIDDERVMLVFSQHVQAGDWLVESRDHALKNSPEMAQHPPDRLVIEAAAVIDDAHLDLGAGINYHSERIIGPRQMSMHNF